MPRPFNPETYNGWRKLVYRKCGYRCVYCGSSQRIEAHHIVPASRNISLIYDVNNGVALCHVCHKKTDTYGGKARTHDKNKREGSVLSCQ